jgi:hypothetical protein
LSISEFVLTWHCLPDCKNMASKRGWIIWLQTHTSGPYRRGGFLVCWPFCTDWWFDYMVFLNLHKYFE